MRPREDNALYSPASRSSTADQVGHPSFPLPMYTATDPHTGRPTGPTYPATAPAALDTALGAAAAAYAHWQHTSPETRIRFCRKAAQSLRERTPALAQLAHDEMGKLLPEAEAEVEKCATLCDYYAEHVLRLSRPRKVLVEGANAYVTHRPLGLILGIMPWNFPFWQAVRFAVPAVAAGNIALLKHAPNVPGCAAALAEVFAKAGEGLSEGPLLTNLYLDDTATEALVADIRVAGVSLTGSTAAGKKVGAAAGAALKPAVLELGGSDAYLVLADADLEVAVEACFAARRLNSGQSCISAKRLIVVDEVREAFTARLTARVEGVDTLAPMAREDLRGQLHRQVERSVAAGARLVLGGLVPETPGWHYPATLLTDVRPGMPAFAEELFGPVFAIVPARDTEEAIALANDSRFGLGAAVFSRDLAAAEGIARDRLVAGAAFVNDFVRSDPRLPFGGVRESGFGRELSDEGYHAFTNAKTVYVRHP